MRRSSPVVAVVGLLAACLVPTESPIPRDQGGPPGSLPAVRVSVAVSDARAVVGDVVAVGIELSGASPAGAIDVTLRTPGSRLRFLGLSLPAIPDRPAVVRTLPGDEVRVAALAPTGLGVHPVVLMFEVTDEGWLDGLAVARVRVVNARGDEVPTEIVKAVVTGLTPPSAQPRTLRDDEWHPASAVPRSAGGAHAPPGAPLYYGDATLDGVVNIVDALRIARIAVGFLPVAPGDEFEAANLSPFNTADGVAVGSSDPCRPGRACTAAPPYRETGVGSVDIADALAVAQWVAALPTPIVGLAAPEDRPQPDTQGALYPNRPVNFATTVTDLDFSQSIPGGAPGAERPVGATGWSIIYDLGPNGQSSMTRALDLSAPQSPGFVWQLRMPAGAYGGGVPGSGSGAGWGNIGRPVPGSAVYVSYRIKWSSNWWWHPVSTKHVRLFDGNLLIQAVNSGRWMRAEAGSFGVAYEPQVNTPLAVGVWHHVEIVAIGGAPGVLKIWVDGQLRTNYTSLPVPAGPNSFSIDAFMGGGGYTLAADQFYWLDHVLIATP